MDRHNTPETFHDANLMMFIKRLRTLDFDFAGNDEAEKKRMALRQVITLLVVVVWASRTGGAGAHFCMDQAMVALACGVATVR